MKVDEAAVYNDMEQARVTKTEHVVDGKGKLAIRRTLKDPKAYDNIVRQ